MAIQNDDFVGLRDHTNLSLVKNGSDYILLSASGAVYKVINSIPILVDEVESFLSDSYLFYGKHLITQEDCIEEFAKYYKNHPLRINIFANIKKAVEHNNSIIQDIIGSIENYFSRTQLLRCAISTNQPTVEYPKSFRYLKRDWTGLPESESQLRIIIEAINDSLTYLEDTEACLVMGAGLGRIACDLRNKFSRIYAMDKSWSMAYLFQQLFQQDILFYDINNTNLTRDIHATRFLKAGFSYAGMTSDDVNVIREKLVYFVSDVRSMPLHDESISCILSIYFTDVVNLELYISEVHRILKNGGIFIHIGPLGLQSPEEIKAYFYKLGYDHQVEKKVESSHLDSFESSFKTVVQNWIFVTRKTTSSFSNQAKSLSNESVLEYICDVSYTIEGQLSVHDNSGVYCKITATNGKKYQVSECFVQFLSLIDGSKTLSILLDELCKIFEFGKEDESDLFEITKQLINDGVIQIKSKK